MCTRLIEGVCGVRSVSAGGWSGGGSLVVDLGELAGDCRLGDSIAVGGACLTVTRLDGPVATFGLSRETMERSTLAAIRPPAQVNIERAMKATDRFGGHIVQGHVDGLGSIRAISRLGEFADIEFAAGAEVLEQMGPKGSVAVDGGRLRVAGV